MCLRRNPEAIGLLAFLAVLFAAMHPAPVTAESLQLPPIVKPATQEHHVGKIVFQELVTPDIAAAKRFYGELFGWTYRDIRSGGITYAEAIMDGRPVAGLIHKDMPAGKHPAWLTFVSVRDVDAVKRLALENGGKILLEPRTIPDRGKEAVLSDPQGAVFAIIASSSGDPADVLVAGGEWIWSSLSATDPDSDAAFYQRLFDYEVFELPAGTGTQHLLLAADGYARASVNSFPSGTRGHAHWLNYVRVEDAAKMTAKVVALGGRVLVEPRVDRHGGKVAVVADPLGAPFGLMEWVGETEEVTK